MPGQGACDFPGCLCNSPDCDCHRHHPKPDPMDVMREADLNWWKRECASLQELLKEVHRTAHISGELAERIAEAVRD